MFTRCLLTLVILLVLAAPPVPAVDRSETPSTPATTGAPVTLNGTPLFYVREKVLSYPPTERARLISARLEKLLHTPQVDAATITTTDSDASTDIVAGDLVIMSVTDRDARGEGTTRQELARRFRDRIAAAIVAYRDEYSSRSLLEGSAYAALATLILVAALLFLKKLFPLLHNRLQSWKGTKIRSLRVQSLEIVNAERIVSLLASLLRGGRLVITLTLFYFYIPLVFSFFPQTQGFAAQLFGHLISPLRSIGHAIGAYLPNIFFILVILLVTHYVIKLIRFVFAEIGKGTITIPGFYQDWAEPTFKIVRFLVLAFAAVVVFPYLPGSNSPAFKGISIFLGVLFSLGSTSAVANIVAGVILTYTRGFKTGDRVKIAETVGDVVEKTLLVTRIRTIKNVDVTIPNSMVISSHVVNYSSSADAYGLILHTSVTIGYDTPWRTVHQLLIEAAKRTEHILELPAPFVLQTALNDFYVTYELNAYTDQPHKMMAIYSALHQQIQDRFNEAGVEIMSPHYSQLRDGNSTTIPESYRPPGYVAPSIRISRPDEAAPTE